MNREDGDYTRGAAAAAVEVGTGEILALASYPTYNLDTFRQEHLRELSTDRRPALWNRATRAPIPPAPPSSLSPPSPRSRRASDACGRPSTATGHWEYPNSIYGTYCWRSQRPRPSEHHEAITESCNYFFADMGYRLGMDNLREYFCRPSAWASHTGIEIGD